MGTELVVLDMKMDVLGSLAGELSPGSQRIYLNDGRAFLKWCEENGHSPKQLSRESMTQYRAYLVQEYKPATAKRMFSVIRRILDEQVRRGVLPVNPAHDVRAIRAEDESPHIALSREQAVNLLGVIDRETKKGKRDYAMLLLLLLTGIRRFECAALTLGDMKLDHEHHVMVIQAGKGHKRATVKMKPEVWRAIDEYLVATGRKTLPDAAPLFCQFRKGDVPQAAGMKSTVVYRTVMHYAERAGIDDLTPHGLRASFVTLALEGGAKLEQVQDAARHKDPRTTERYWRRRNMLDDNAVDYIRLGIGV